MLLCRKKVHDYDKFLAQCECTLSIYPYLSPNPSLIFFSLYLVTKMDFKAATSLHLLLPQRKIDWPFILIWNSTLKLTIAFKEPEHWKPNPCPQLSTIVKGLCIGQCMIVQEDTRGNVESYEYINTVVLMCSKNEENTKNVE